MFGFGIWGVGREEVGIKRTNNAVEAFRRAFSTGLADGNHLGVWRFAETLQSQQNITDKDISDFEMGVEKVPHRRQLDRDQRILAIASRYREDGDMMRMARGVARNYM